MASFMGSDIQLSGVLLLQLHVVLLWTQAEPATAQLRTATPLLSTGPGDGSISDIGTGSGAAVFLSGEEALGLSAAFDYVPSSASLSSCRPQLTSGVATLPLAHPLNAVFQKSVVLTTGNRNAAVISSQRNVMSSTAVVCPRQALVSAVRELDLAIFSFRLLAKKPTTISFWYALATNENATSFGKGFKDSFRLRLQKIVAGQIVEQTLFSAGMDDGINGVSNQAKNHAISYAFFTTPARTDRFSVGASEEVQVTFEISDGQDRLVDSAVYLAPVLGEGGNSVGDPMFSGADKEKFYFHGRRGQSFCIFSDKGLHINSHFVGRKAPQPKTFSVFSNDDASQVPTSGHDRTWMQSLTIFFPGHQIFIGARQEKTWSKELDHLIVKVDGEEILVPALKHQQPSSGKWQSPETTKSRPFIIQRTNIKNQAKVIIPGLLVVNLKIVPTKPATWTQESCFPHLDVAYEFSGVTPVVDGVLGRTYKSRSLLDTPTESMTNKKKKGAYILKNADDYWAPMDDEPMCRVGQYMGDDYVAPDDLAASAQPTTTLGDDEGQASAGASSGSGNKTKKKKHEILCKSHPRNGGMACR